MNVFARLFGDDGEAKEINLGSLYSRSDSTSGFLHELAVEPYGTEDLDRHEAFLDGFNYIPEVPKHVRIEKESVSTQPFFGGKIEVDLEPLKDEPEQMARSLADYEAIVKSAYRLYERTMRAEPVFVGLTDIKRHRNLPTSTVLGLDEPFRRLPGRAHRLRSLEQRRIWTSTSGTQTSLKVFADTEEKAGRAFPERLRLDLCVDPDGLVCRADCILGLADRDRPLVISENGNLRIGDRQGLFTNLMACKIGVGEPILVLANYCRDKVVLRINKTEVVRGPLNCELI